MSGQLRRQICKYGGPPSRAANRVSVWRWSFFDSAASQGWTRSANIRPRIEVVEATSESIQLLQLAHIGDYERLRHLQGSAMIYADDTRFSPECVPPRVDAVPVSRPDADCRGLGIRVAHILRIAYRLNLDQ
ncbi:MAG: hypothetical protein ACLT76_03095 [Clostridium fessum]